jgi:hypothetical protein
MLATAFFTTACMLPGCVFLRARLPPRQPLPFVAVANAWKDTRYASLVLGTSMFLIK